MAMVAVATVSQMNSSVIWGRREEKKDLFILSNTEVLRKLAVIGAGTNDDRDRETYVQEYCSHCQLFQRSNYHHVQGKTKVKKFSAIGIGRLFSYPKTTT